MALQRAKAAVAKLPNLPPPKHILNAPTKMMKELGYSAGYLYNHDHPELAGQIVQQYLPEEIKDEVFFIPNERDDLDLRPARFSPP
jgi:putative ATPase